ncbi:MAG TPA: ferredoxin [Rhodococcus sp. (in: high G+C Gram-positive bacteria)]|jgi:ferredoxin|nr:ferredoxin [Rhodococcus sp. (in: high G+C Gram-positive bacteria)]
MKVTLDTDLCEAHGLCEASAPELFQLGDEDIVTILEDNPAPELQDAARRAAGSCPRIAIQISED